MIRTWRPDDSRQKLVPGSRQDHLAEVVYWGSCLPDDEELETVYRSRAIDVAGGMLDIKPGTVELPGGDTNFSRTAGVDVPRWRRAAVPAEVLRRFGQGQREQP